MNRVGINYLYFGLFFLLLVLTCTASIILKDNLTGSRFFFLFYSIGQTALEVTIFAFLAGVINRFLGRWGFWFFIGGTFLLLIIHIIDFMIDRVLDLSVWRAMKVFIFDESLENFYYLLDASGLPLWMWVVAFGMVGLVPFLGMLIYKATSWLTQKKPLFVKNEHFVQLFICIPAALLFWDFSASRVVDPDAYTEFTKSLPWKRTFLQPKTVQLPMNQKLRPPKTEEEVARSLSQVEPIEKKPNIFLFIAESLREDILDQEVAPNLLKFREEAIRGKVSFSNANATHLSWFSIFHSEFSFYWQKLQAEGWRMGSPSLALFKKLGYKIRVYCSAELNYYEMGELLFGKNYSQVDSLQLFPHPPPKEASTSDAAAISALKKDLETQELQQGQLIIVFLDTTHFDYSWPKSTSRFTPFATEFAYFRTFHSKYNIELIKNRYRNAVHYLDSLFGQIVFPPDALVAFTGDHGEEFFDHGHLFHLSHLVNAQTRVPIYLKIPGKTGTVELLSQMDIFPTLLDGVAQISSPILGGESALREKKWPFVAIARFNASHSPYEFCLHNGKEKVMLQFENRKNIFDCTDLRILSLRSAKEISLREKKQEWIYQEFGPALERLFWNSAN